MHSAGARRAAAVPEARSAKRVRRAVPALAGAAAAAVIGLSSGHARANGRFPAANQILFWPGDPHLVVARTTYGILVSRDDGASWTYLCEEALGLPSSATQDPELAFSAGGALVAGLDSPIAGLDVSTDVGCDWRCVGGPLAGLPIADLTFRAGAPGALIALASSYLPADAGAGTLTQLYESADDGATWAQLGVPIDPTVVVQTVDVAPASPGTMYVSGTRGYGAARTASLFVSADQGAHWTERPIAPFDAATEASVFIGAVDPVDSARVYVRTSAALPAGRSRLLVTLDAGQSFQVVQAFDVADEGGLATAGEILGFALSPDGSRIYTGTKEGGLFAADRSDLAFAQKASIHVQCLATRGSELWACSDVLSGFIVGSSNDDGATFTAKLPTVTALAGPVACASDAGARASIACGATANAAQCGPSFEAFCQADDPNGRCAPAAGAPGGEDAGAAADGGQGARPASSGAACGCRVARGTSWSGCAGCAVVVGAATARRARAKRRRGSSVRTLALLGHADQGQG